MHPPLQRRLHGGARHHLGYAPGFDPGQMTQPLHREHLGRILTVLLRQRPGTTPDRGEIGSGGGSHRRILHMSTRRSSDSGTVKPSLLPLTEPEEPQRFLPYSSKGLASFRAEAERQAPGARRLLEVEVGGGAGTIGV